MKQPFSLMEEFRSLKPETKRLLRSAPLLLLILYLFAALLLFSAGSVVEYQAALIYSQSLATGIKAGFGLLCIGLLVLECK
ncbi:MAG: hypothetical protein LBQ33_05130 [Oscillospiraceae bacterium]|nr:hypothetical protein [Oscillospiraceae bacterium]